MSTDQIKRAAEELQDASMGAFPVAVAALLRAAAADPWFAPHRHHNFGCRLPSGDGDAKAGDCPACRIEDIATAYLGEETQP